MTGGHPDNRDPNLYPDPEQEQNLGPKDFVLDTLEILVLILILVVDRILETRTRIRIWFGNRFGQ